jgi:chromosome segregation ATPase
MREGDYERSSPTGTAPVELLTDLEAEREALEERERHLAAVEEELEARQARAEAARHRLEQAERARLAASAELERRMEEIAAREQDLVRAVAEHERAAAELDARRAALAARETKAQGRADQARAGAQDLSEQIEAFEQAQSAGGRSSRRAPPSSRRNIPRA